MDNHPHHIHAEDRLDAALKQIASTPLYIERFEHHRWNEWRTEDLLNTKQVLLDGIAGYEQDQTITNDERQRSIDCFRKALDEIEQVLANPEREEK